MGKEVGFEKEFSTDEGEDDNIEEIEFFEGLYEMIVKTMTVAVAAELVVVPVAEAVAVMVMVSVVEKETSN